MSKEISFSKDFVRDHRAKSRTPTVRGDALAPLSPSPTRTAGREFNHLHDSLQLSLNILTRYRREGKPLSEDDLALVRAIAEFSKPDHLPAPATAAPNNRMAELLTKLRAVGTTPAVYKEMVATKDEVNSLSNFALRCTRAGLSVEELVATISVDMANITTPPIPVNIYLLDVLDESLIDQSTGLAFPIDDTTPMGTCAARREEVKHASGQFMPLIADDMLLGVLQLGLSEQLTPTRAAVLDAMGSIAALSLRNMRLFENVRWQIEKAEAMLSMANRLTRDNLDEHLLVQSIMVTAKQLTDSDRCSIFIVKGDVLQAYFEDGNIVTMSIDTGIAGHVAKTGATVNIAEAYEDARFNAAVDKATGYRTKTILCMPVLYEGTIVAVAQLINKKPRRNPDGSLVERIFSKRDEELFVTFSTFAGVSLRNCKITNELAAEQKKSVAILDVVTLLSNTDIRDVNAIVSHVMLGAKKLLSADRASLFLLDKERNELYSKVADSTGGKEIRFPMGKGIAGTVAASGVAENIRDAYQDERFNREIDKQFGYRTHSILCEPISLRGEVIAVAQLVNKIDPVHGTVTTFTYADQETFRTFALFAGISISNSHLLEFAVRAGQEAMALNSRRDNLGVGGRRPSSSTLHPIQQAERDAVRSIALPDGSDTSSPAFDLFAVRDFCSERPQDAAVAVVMQVIMATGLPQKFNCREDVLLNFVCQCRRRYRKVPYHNFYHAVDVCQTISTFLFVGRVSELLTDLECYVLLITALVHDLDHMGVNNSFHLKTDSPLGILSSASGNNSVLEVHHCNLAIEILEDDASNVFGGIKDSKELTTAYRAMIDCILATDMARHNELVNTFNALTAEGFVKDKEEHRRLAMQMVLKAADISNVTKPFDVSRLWAVAVTEEFYQQGDKEKERGVAVLPMFDRAANNELAKGQIGFINFVAFKFFETIVTKLFTGMQWAFDNIVANRQQWQSILDNAARSNSVTMVTQAGK